MLNDRLMTRGQHLADQIQILFVISALCKDFQRSALLGRHARSGSGYADCRRICIQNFRRALVQNISSFQRVISSRAVTVIIIAFRRRSSKLIFGTFTP